eukprot:symbB.v1.2.030393.t1/scaffold3420.1/size57189/1
MVEWQQLQARLPQSGKRSDDIPRRKKRQFLVGKIRRLSLSGAFFMKGFFLILSAARAEPQCHYDRHVKEHL